MSSKPGSSNLKSVSQASNKNSKKLKDSSSEETCEVCNVWVSIKNRGVHEKGKRHQNNLNKKVKRRGKKQNLKKKILRNSSTNDEEASETTQNNASNIEDSNEASEDLSQLDQTDLPHESPARKPKKRSPIFPSTKFYKNKKFLEIPSGLEQQPTDFVQINFNMPNDGNQNNSQARYHREDSFHLESMPPESRNYAYWNRGHPNSGFRRPPRGNPRHFENPNGRRQAYWHNPHNWNGMDGSTWHQPPKPNRYFGNPYPGLNPNDANPFFLDTGGSYEQFNSNENYFPYETAQYPLESNSGPQSNPLGSTSKNTEKVENEDSEINVAEEPKALKRRNQSVRAIRSASIAIRNSLDSDDAQHEGTGDKQLEKKNVPNETVTGKRIAHWIKPSNPKDEAEVRRLVTEFSKSKKKENLLRLKQQSESRIDRRDSASDEISSTIDMITSAVEGDKCDSSSLDTSIEIVASVPSKLNKKRVSSNSKRKSLNAESHPDSDSSKSSSSIANTSRVKRNSLQIDASPNISLSERKRKSSTEQSNSKSKKFTSSTNLESVLDAVIRGNPDSSSVSPDAVLSKRIESHIEESTSDAIVPKKEPVDSTETNQNQSYTKPFNLNDFLQCQEGSAENSGSTEATMTPVESLINLFASGNVKVKKEFDDPLIDAIRTLDPAVLNKVCDNQSATNSSASPSQTPSPAVENPSGKPNPSVTGSLKAILKELQKISDKERKIKDSLQEADQKIQEYQMLLDEWKTKKIKIQSEEEILGHQRNTLVKSMNDLVTEDFTVPNFLENTEVDPPTTHPLSSDDIANNESCSTNNVPSMIPTKDTAPKPKYTNCEQVGVSIPATSTKAPRKEVRQNVEIVEEEIAIIPVPCKSDQIPVIDLDDDPVVLSDGNRMNLTEDSLNAKLSEWQAIAAHQVVVNSIQVFEDYLYTCSNDSTAKRFDLKDISKTVTYLHEKKIVTQLCVEKVDGITVVFTVCAASNVISAFKAENGTVLNTFTFQNNVASICRGRDKIYAGLRDGSIFTCNCKEQKEIVSIGDNLRSIALTYQGCISILVTLAVNGCVSIRDAERNGLLIRTVKSIKNVPLFMKVHGDCIYLSGSGVLIVLEIGTAKCIAQYDLSAPYTSLTAHQGYIFTTSYSGLVRCYSQEGVNAVQVYYGAGNTSLTCINVYNDWVFTGNRFGAVDVFKFDPHTCLPCQMGKCDMIFAREKDLEFHILSGSDHDLPSAGSKCSWRTCRTTFPRNSKLEVVKCHIREHIKTLHFQDHQTLYNFSL